MKLYTEEQVREAYLEGWTDGQHENIGYIDRVVFSLTPIELPTDEEIQQEADCFHGLESYNSTFKQGAKWMRDKIQGGNK
jgi:hypothetical protein